MPVPAEDQPPPWLAPALGAFPRLREAWEDPLFEHWRMRTPRKGLFYFADPAALGALCGLILASLAYGVFGLGMAAAFHWLLYIPMDAFLRRAKRLAMSDSLDLLRSPLHRNWSEVSIDAARGAPLVALLGIIDGRRSSEYSTARYVLLYAAVVILALMMLRGILSLLAAAAIMAAAALLLPPMDRRRTGKALPFLSTVRHAVAGLTRFVTPMAFPPLSQDSTSTVNERKMSYGEFYSELESGHHSDAGTHALCKVLADALEGTEGCWRRWISHGCETTSLP